MSGGMEDSSAAAKAAAREIKELMFGEFMKYVPEEQLIMKATHYGSDAPGFLIEAADTIGNRASERDHEDGERSMARTVAMFNAWRGQSDGPLSETDGWAFMVFLKLARAAGGKFKRDDFVDGAAYMALAGESAERDATR